MRRNKIIAVDFDGTICENAWPRIGDPIQPVIDYILDEQKKGTRIILWTCRSKELLIEALVWSKEHGIIFDAVNGNIPEMIATFGSDTRKIFADEYIDDRNISIEEIMK